MIKCKGDEKDATYDEESYGVEDYLLGDLYIKNAKGYKHLRKRKKRVLSK